MPITDGIYASLSEAGEKPPVVLLHGAGGSHLSWPPQIRRLPANTVIALDLPGHGRSNGPGMQSIPEYADSVSKWMHAVDLKSAVLVGHSMGSAIALHLAVAYPALISGLGLIGSAAHLRVNPELIAESADERKFPQAVEKIIAWSFSPSYPERLKKLVADRMELTNPKVLAGDLVACDLYDSSEILKMVRCPTLVLSGEKDKMVPARMAVHLADQIPTAQLEIVPDAGHMVMLERPDEVAAILARFLSGLGLR